MLAIVVEQLTPITEIEGLKHLHISPNPSSGKVKVNFQFEEITKSTISIYNSVGSVIFEDSFENQNDYNLKLEDIPSGSYTVLLSTIKGSISRKFVVIQ